METKTTRIAKWDNVRLILILCVVIGHTIKPFTSFTVSAKNLYYYIYLFHMPAFILVSGMFSKHAIHTKRYDRVFGFLVLYFAVKFLGFFSEIAAYGKTRLSLFNETGVAWYALAIFFYYLAMMFLAQFKKSYVLVLSLVVGCLSGYARDTGSHLALMRVLNFFPYFVIGYYLKQETVAAFTAKKSVKLCAAVILVALFVLTYRYSEELNWTLQFLKGRATFRRIPYFPEWGVLWRLLQYAVALLMTFSIIALAPSKKNPLSYIGARTLSVYALHTAVLVLFFGCMDGKHLVQKIMPSKYILILLVIAVILTWLLAQKPFDWLIRKMIFPEKEEKHE